MAKVSEKQCAEALEKSGGFVTHAAKMLGIAASTLSERIKRSPRLQKVREDVRESLLDMAETSLLKAVKEGEAWAVCFFLKCQGKKRGYVERLEVLEEAPMPQSIKVEIVDGQKEKQ